MLIPVVNVTSLPFVWLLSNLSPLALRIIPSPLYVIWPFTVFLKGRSPCKSADWNLLWCQGEQLFAFHSLDSSRICKSKLTLFRYEHFLRFFSPTVFPRQILGKTNCPHIYLFLHMHISYLPLGKLWLVDNSFLQHTTHTTDLSFFSLPPFFRAKYLTMIAYVSSSTVLIPTHSTIP